jgi:Uma2 family endonuclease
MEGEGAVMVRLARRKNVQIGPDDDGRRMTLAEFDHVTVEDGFRYELGEGVIQVSEVPGPEHLAQVEELREQLYAYKRSHRGVIYAIASANDAKLLVPSFESERHPDLSVYFSRPPAENVWSLWIPKIVIEVVSKRSTQRDYEQKPGEYLDFGVSEYWIVDSIEGKFTVNTRWRGQWKPQVVKPPSRYSTPLLTGFSLNIKRIFAAATRK